MVVKRPHSKRLAFGQGQHPAHRQFDVYPWAIGAVIVEASAAESDRAPRTLCDIVAKSDPDVLKERDEAGTSRSRMSEQFVAFAALAGLESCAARHNPVLFRQSSQRPYFEVKASSVTSPKRPPGGYLWLDSLLQIGPFFRTLAMSRRGQSGIPDQRRACFRRSYASIMRIIHGIFGMKMNIRVS